MANNNFTPDQIASWGAQSAENLRRALEGATETPGRAQTSDQVEKQEMVTPEVRSFPGRAVFVIPCVTRSEANESAWVKKMRRKLSAKAATRATLGPDHWMLTEFAHAYHDQQALRIVFTRLGGRRLDKGNLSVSMKAVEDVVAGALLADDGSPLWVVSYAQEPGGPCGVRVEIEILPKIA